MADERIMDFFNESNNGLNYKPKNHNQFKNELLPNYHDKQICNNKDRLNENVLLKNIYRLEQVKKFIFFRNINNIVLINLN